MQANIGSIVSTVFPGKVEAFSVYRIFLAIGVVSMQFLIIILIHA
jgi:hypothetical protein